MTVATVVAAPVDRVWRALTIPDEVCAWDGVAPLDVPDDYPRVGQHALWRSPFGRLRLTLHDRITAVEKGRRMAASIDIAFVHVDEEYTLLPLPEGKTVLLTDDAVRARVPGLGRLARRLTRANVSASMTSLKEHCERPGNGTSQSAPSA